MTNEADAVLRFWLDDASRSPDHLTARNAVWFGSDSVLDAEICEPWLRAAPGPAVLIQKESEDAEYSIRTPLFLIGGQNNEVTLTLDP